MLQANRRRCHRLAVLLALFLAWGALGSTSADFGLKRALAQDESSTAAVLKYNRGISIQKKRVFPLAAKTWQEFIAEFPKDPRIAHAHHNLGICQFEQNQLTEAAATFRVVLTKFPKFESLDSCQLNLGLALYRQALETKKPEDLKAAAAVFAELATKFPKSNYVARALYNQAESLFAAADVKGAVAVYQKIVATYPKFELLADTYYALGTAQQELAAEEPALDAEAAKTFAMFVQKFPEHELAAECSLRQGLSLFNRGTFEEAEKIFAKVAQVKDFNYADFAMLRQAECRAQQNDFAAAVTICAQLLKAYPESSYKTAAQMRAGVSQYQAGKYAEAVAFLDPAAKAKAPESPESAHWLGLALIKAEKPAEALAALDAAIAAYAQSPQIKQLQYTRLDAQYEIPEQRKVAVDGYLAFAKANAADPLAPKAQYMAALGSLVLEQYPAGIQNAELFLAAPYAAEHELLPEVLYIAAESHVQGATNEAAGANVAKAEAHYKQLVTKFPEHRHAAIAQLRVGLCLYLAKKHDEAVAYLTQAVAKLQDPAHKAEAYLWTGRAHADKERHAQASQALDAAAKAKPDWTRGDEVLLALAVSLRSESKLPEASAALNRLAATFTKSEYLDQATFQLGEIAFEQAELAKTPAEKNKKLDEALAFYRQVIEKFADSDQAPLALYRSGRAHYDKQDYSPAVETLTLLSTKYPKDEIAPRGLYVRGLAYQQLKDYAKAVADLNAYLATKPEQAESLGARHALALCQVGLKQYDAAVASFQALLKEKPDYPDADKIYYQTAFAQEDAGKKDEAVATFRTLVTKLPDSPLVPESYLRIGIAEEEAEKYAEALTSFTAGLAKAKEPKLQEHLQFKQGWTQFNLEKYPEASVAFANQLKAHPEGDYAGDATYLGGESLLKQEKWTEALPLFQKVITQKLEKYHDRALYRAGHCTAKLGQWPASEAHFNALVTQFPKYVLVREAQYHQGRALQMQKKFPDARTVYLAILKAEQAAEGQTETAAKARFMLGECSFSEGKFADAAAHFEECSNCPFKEWQALSQFEAGRCYIELKEVAAAKVTFENMVKKYPDHPKTKDAQKLLASLTGG